MGQPIDVQGGRELRSRAAGTGLRRVATVVVCVATAWFAVAVCWGVCGPVGAGHSSVVGSRGIIAENMVRWHIWSPVREYTFSVPTHAQIYPDHPFGTYWVIGLLARWLGRHEYVQRLEPIAMSIAAPALLYGIGRALWGPMQGALAALAYVVLPLALAFGSFPGFEVPLVFGMLLTTWGYVRFAEKWKTRWLAVSLAGVAWTVNVDWQGSVFLGAALGALLVMHYLLPRWFGQLPARPFGQWWALSASIACATLLAYGAYIVHIDGVNQLLTQKALRERGSDLPVLDVLGARWYWIDSAFTPVAVTVAKIALPIFVYRVIVRKKTREVFPLAMLVMASVTYAHFKNGADAHFYWPLPFAPYWALSMGVVAETVLELGHWVRRRYGLQDPRGIFPAATFGALGLLVLLILPDGVRAMPYGMATGGRFNDRGRRIFQDADKSAALAWMTGRMVGEPRVLIHGSMHSNWANDWALHRPVAALGIIPPRGPCAEQDRYFIADLAFLGAADQQALFAQYHVDVVGQFALADRLAPGAPADGYVFDAREPTALEWYLVSAVDPIRTVRADPWYTWELRDQFGQAPNPAPVEAPRSAEDLRIAHNVARAVGDVAGAERLAATLVKQLDSFPATKFTDGTSLLGDRFNPGVAPTLEVFLEAGGPTQDEDQFDLESTVRRRPLLSIVGTDDLVRTVGRPMFPPPKLWKAGFIYVSRTEIRARPGQETFVGFFTAPAKAHPPVPVDGSTKVRLLALR
jgi:hypothetical protein